MLEISETKQALQHLVHSRDGEDSVNCKDGVLKVGRAFRVGRFPDYFHVFPIFHSSMCDTFIIRYSRDT